MDEVKKKRHDDYIALVFSGGIEPYVKSLQKHKVVGMKDILDIGCGAGEWGLAAAKLNPNALVTGIDIDEYFLNFAKKSMKQNNIENCKFLRESYDNLLNIFQPNSFDVIMCNSVIQYIDEKKAFFIFSTLLRKDGILIMFYNHGMGYFLHKFFSGIKNLNQGGIKYGFKTLAKTFVNLTLNTKYVDHFVTLGHLTKISKKVGIKLIKIETEPKLIYRDYYLGIPYVFSCKGIKI